MMFLLKAKRYAPEGSKHQEAKRNLTNEKKYGNDEK